MLLRTECLSIDKKALGITLPKLKLFIAGRKSSNLTNLFQMRIVVYLT